MSDIHVPVKFLEGLRLLSNAMQSVWLNCSYWVKASKTHSSNLALLGDYLGLSASSFEYLIYDSETVTGLYEEDLMNICGERLGGIKVEPLYTFFILK